MIGVLECHVKDLSFLRDTNLTNIKRSREKCTLLFDKWKEKNVESINKLEVLIDSANSIDSEISEINQKASTIVSKLLTIKNKQEKVIEVEKLLNLIVQLNDSSKSYSFYHDLLKDISYREKAKLLIQLITICEDSESNRLDCAKLNITKLIQSFENELILQFNDLIKNNDLVSLKEIYSILKMINKENRLINEYLEYVTFRSIKIESYTDLNQLMDSFNTMFADCLEKCKSYYFPNIQELFASNQMKVFELVFNKCFDRTIIPFTEEILENIEENSIFLRICTHIIDIKSLYENELSKTTYKLRTIFINEQFEKVFSICRKVGYIEKESANIINCFNETTERRGGEFSPDILTNCFNFMNEVIKRAQFICKTADSHDIISDYILSFITKFFEVLILPLIKSTTHKLTNIQLKLQSIFRITFNIEKLNNSFMEYMRTIQFINSSIVLLQKWFHVDYIEFIDNSSRGNFCLEYKRDLLNSLEESVDESLHKFMDIQIIIIKKYFRKLRKRNKNKSILDESLENSSKECQRICSFLKSISQTISSSLDGENLLIILLSLVNHFIDSLLTHLSKYEVKSEVESLIIVRDLSEYDKIIKEYFVDKIIEIQKNYLNVISLESLYRRVDIIVGISKIYLVHPSQLENVIYEYPCLDTISKSTIYKIISNRYDHDDSWTKKYNLNK